MCVEVVHYYTRCQHTVYQNTSECEKVRREPIRNNARLNTAVYLPANRPKVTPGLLCETVRARYPKEGLCDNCAREEQALLQNNARRMVINLDSSPAFVRVDQRPAEQFDPRSAHAQVDQRTVTVQTDDTPLVPARVDPRSIPAHSQEKPTPVAFQAYHIPAEFKEAPSPNTPHIPVNQPPNPTSSHTNRAPARAPPRAIPVQVKSDAAPPPPPAAGFNHMPRLANSPHVQVGQAPLAPAGADPARPPRPWRTGSPPPVFPKRTVSPEFRQQVREIKEGLMDLSRQFPSRLGPGHGLGDGRSRSPMPQLQSFWDFTDSESESSPESFHRRVRGRLNKVKSTMSLRRGEVGKKDGGSPTKVPAIPGLPQWVKKTPKATKSVMDLPKAFMGGNKTSQDIQAASKTSQDTQIADKTSEDTIATKISQDVEATVNALKPTSTVIKTSDEPDAYAGTPEQPKSFWFPEELEPTPPSSFRRRMINKFKQLK